MIDQQIFKNKAYRYLKLYDKTGLINHLYAAKTEIDKIIKKEQANKIVDVIIDLCNKVIKGDKAKRYAMIKLCQKYSTINSRQIAIRTGYSITTCHTLKTKTDNNFEYWVEHIEKQYLRKLNL